MSVMNDMNDAEYALKVRVATLETLIRDVAIPALNIGRSCFPTIREAEDKLREAIK